MGTLDKSLDQLFWLELSNTDLSFPVSDRWTLVFGPCKAQQLFVFHRLARSKRYGVVSDVVNWQCGIDVALSNEMIHLVFLHCRHRQRGRRA